MGDTYDTDDIPDTVIKLSSDDVTPSAPEYVYLHLDDADEFEDDPTTAQQLYLYTFEHEDRTDELLDTIDELRQDFIFARGIVWPDVLADEVREADTERLRALEWAVAVLPHMEDYQPEDLSEVADQAGRWLERRGAFDE